MEKARGWHVWRRNARCKQISILCVVRFYRASVTAMNLR